MFTLGWTDDDGLELFTLSWYLSVLDSPDEAGTFYPTFFLTFDNTMSSTYDETFDT